MKKLSLLLFIFSFSSCMWVSNILSKAQPPFFEVNWNLVWFLIAVFITCATAGTADFFHGQTAGMVTLFACILFFSVLWIYPNLNDTGRMIFWIVATALFGTLMIFLFVVLKSSDDDNGGGYDLYPDLPPLPPKDDRKPKPSPSPKPNPDIAREREMMNLVNASLKKSGKLKVR